MNTKDSLFPVYVVSMVSATERREAINKQLAGYDGTWRYQDAVVPGVGIGTSWTSEEGRRSVPVLGRSLTKGEFGCALSHLQIYKSIAGDKHEAAIVLEDDALISADLFHVCQGAMKSAKFDVLILGYSKVNARDQCIRNIAEPMIGFLEVFGRTLGHAYRERRSGTVGYLITKEGATKLQAIQGDVVTVADDWPYFRKQGLKIIHVRPAVVLEDFFTTESSIAKDRSLAEKKWNQGSQTLRQIARLVRGSLWSIKLRLNHSRRS